MASFYSGGYMGDLCGSLEPPFGTKLFYFCEDILAKSA